MRWLRQAVVAVELVVAIGPAAVAAEVSRS